VTVPDMLPLLSPQPEAKSAASPKQQLSPTKRVETRLIMAPIQ
jgi:hypothetical protein